MHITLQYSTTLAVYILCNDVQKNILRIIKGALQDTCVEWHCVLDELISPNCDGDSLLALLVRWNIKYLLTVDVVYYTVASTVVEGSVVYGNVLGNYR